jgi:hypothetical protein
MGAKTINVRRNRGHGPTAPELRAKGVLPPEPVIAPAPEAASFATKAGRLLREGRAWMRAGLPIADKATRTARLAVCAQCQYYNAAGNLGLGECKAPGCGCTRVKLALATSKCPLGKWAAVPLRKT